MQTITSRQHPIVRKFRDVARGDESLALLDGWHLLHEAAAAAVDLDTIAIAGEPERADDRDLIDRLVGESHLMAIAVSSSVLGAISPVRTPSGVVALARRAEVSLSQLLSPSPALIVVAIDVQDAGNAGAIVRSAEAGGASGVVFAGESADPWGWKALRAAMGSTFRLPVMRQRNAVAACELLRRHDLRLIATVPRGGTLMHEANLRPPAGLLLGAEGSGLPAEIEALADSRISIPMQQPVDSLNVAVASGLLVYEARRQRMAG